MQLEYELWGNEPVQALGTIAGKELYFHAKYDEWEFEVAHEGDKFPSDGGDGFARGGKMDRAGFMSEEQARALIERAAGEYFAKHPMRDA